VLQRLQKIFCQSGTDSALVFAVASAVVELAGLRAQSALVFLLSGESAHYAVLAIHCLARLFVVSLLAPQEVHCCQPYWPVSIQAVQLFALDAALFALLEVQQVRVVFQRLEVQGHFPLVERFSLVVLLLLEALLVVLLETLLAFLLQLGYYPVR
jgi:hypothetical protein